DVNLEGEVHAGTGDPFMEIKPVVRLNTPEPFDGSERKNCVGPFALMMSIVQANQWEVHALGVPTVWDTDVLPVYLCGPNDTHSGRMSTRLPAARLAMTAISSSKAMRTAPSMRRHRRWLSRRLASAAT